MKRSLGKKPLSLFCAVALIASLSFPVAAFAADGETAAGQANGNTASGQAPKGNDEVQDPVARVGDVGYASLEEAIAAAKAGDTVKLLKDVQDFEGAAINRDITIDFGGKTVGKANGTVFDIYANVAFKNGSIQVRNNSKGAGSVIWLNRAASLTVEKNVWIFAPQNDFCISFWSDCSNATLNLYGELSGGNGITVNGNITSPNTVNANGATITVNGHGIYQAGFAATSVKDSTIAANATGIEVRAGNLVVDNSTIKGGDSFTCGPNGGGTAVDGAGIAIAQHTTKQAIDVTVNSGAISGNHAICEKNVQQNSVEDISKVKLAINGGSFTGVVFSENLNGFISAGAFNAKPDAGYVANGYVATLNNAGLYDITKKQAVVADKESKSDGSVVVNASDVKPQVAPEAQNQLAQAALGSANSLKNGRDLPVAVKDQQKLKADLGTISPTDSASATLVVNAQPSAVADEAINKAKSKNEAITPLDLSVSLLVSVADADGVVKSSVSAEVAQLPEELTITVTVDPSTVKGKVVRIARNHDDKVDFIDPINVDEATGAITFKTDRFSSYAVLTSDKAPEVVYHEVKFVDKFNDFTNVALVESGKAIDQPEDPYFRGYQFAGWFTDEAASEKYDFSNPVSGDITLYAGYKKVEYEGEKTDEADKTVDKPTTEQPAPQKESAIAQTGDNASMLVVGAVSAVALVVALGAIMMRRRNQR